MKSKLLFSCFALLFSFLTYAQIGIGQPIDLFECDDFNNGTEGFDVFANDAFVLEGLNPTNYEVTYHITLQDAETGNNPITFTYFNTANPEVIYVRVFELATGNFEIADFLLILEDVPTPNIQDIYEVCTGSEILVDSGLGGQPFAFAWYRDGFQIAGEEASSIVVSEPGFYSLQIISDAGCTSFTEFQLVEGNFDNLTSPTPLEVCDDDGDGFAFFILNEATQEILAGIQNPSVVVTYHASQLDADLGVNALDPTSYVNTEAYNQVLFARVGSLTSDCYAVVPLELVVNVDCIVLLPVEAFVCVDNFEMTVEYDLTIHEDEILGGQNTSEFTFSYYISLTNAQSENNPIVNPDMFLIDSSNSVVYVRVEHNVTGNSSITEIYLNFIMNPLVDFNGPYSLCDGEDLVLTPFINGNGQYTYSWNTGETSPEIVVTTAGTYTVTVTDDWTGCTGSAVVDVILGGNAPTATDPTDLTSCVPGFTYDLTALIPEIIGAQDPSSLVVSFHNFIEFAIANTNPITNPESYLPADPFQTIFVRVQNASDTCYSLADFTITTLPSCPIEVICGEEPVNTSYCYDINDATQYIYESSDGTPLQVFFNAGQVEVNWDELVVLDSDGITNLNPESTWYGYAGDLTGLSFTSTGGSITVYIDSDQVFSCATDNYVPVDYDVSCVDLDAVPGCNSVLTLPEDGADSVNETTNLSWTASSGIVNGYILSVGITAGGTEVVNNEDVGNVLTYDLDVLDFEVTYYVTITAYNDNGNAENCQEFSFTTRPNPNQTVVCGDGIVNTTYCYGNNDDSTFNFQSSDGSTLTLVFNAGSTEINFDEISIVDSDGTVLNEGMPYGNAGDFTGMTYTSTGDNISVVFDTDGSVSCANGSGCCTEQFDFDVFCTSSVGIIEVNAFVDDNGNSIYDTDEFSFSNGYFTYEVNGDGMVNVVNSSTGSFQIISTNETDTYDINFNLYEESAGCYDVTVAMVDDISVNTGSTVTVDFPVVEEQSCEDLAVYLINYWTPPRPGFSHENHLVLENLGFTTIASGTVEFVADPLLIFNSATANNPSYTIANTANGFTVDFVNLQPGDEAIIDISLTCPASVALGDIVTNTATYITDSNDMVLSNNYSTLSEMVVGSWDPNDKMESHGPRVNYDAFAASDEWLYYTIRFQNLGTFPATFITIDDTLDAQLDESTFQMLRSSHDYVVTRSGNDLEWFFEDINLPAAQDDEEGSQGFVFFRIKPQAGYAIGDIIPNTAAIFFDFNAPVITNRFETEFVDDALSIAEVNAYGFDMFPNPAQDVVTIKLNNLSNATISIVDIQGKLIQENNTGNQQQLELNISELQSGLYFVKLTSNDKVVIQKLIKD